MFEKNVEFNEDLCIVKDIVRIDRAMTRMRQSVRESENEEVYQVHEQYANRAETKAATALYYRLRTELKKLCISSEIGLVCREEDIEAIQELEQKYKDQVIANNFQHVRVYITICLFRVSSTNSKAFQQISEDLKRQVSSRQESLATTENQKRSVEQNLKNVSHTVDDIREAVRTIDIAKLARDSQFLDTIMNFDIDEETKDSIKKLRESTTGLIKEVKDWRADASRFDFLILDEEGGDSVSTPSS